VIIYTRSLGRGDGFPGAADQVRVLKDNRLLNRIRIGQASKISLIFEKCTSPLPVNKPVNWPAIQGFEQREKAADQK
jgi:hypothetical protein